MVYFLYICIMENRKLAGIYKILNTRNKKFYIGSAKSLYYRKATHFTNLSKNKHHNKPLQNSYNKYGKSCFDFIVLEYCEIDCLIEKEQHYIDTFKPHYNLCKTAGSPIGIKRSEETKNKISKNHAKHNLGKVFNDEIRKNMSLGQKKRLPPSELTKNKIKNSLSKAVIKYDLDMNILDEYKSLKEASLMNNIPYKYLSSLITGKKKSKSIKLIFKYK